MGQVQTFDQRNHPWSGLSLALLLCFGRPVEGVALHLGIAQPVQGLLELGPDPPLPVFVDVYLGEERLIVQPPVQIVAPPVDARDVRQQAERVLQILLGFQVLVVVRGDVVVDRLSGGTDAGLLTFEHVQRHRVRVMGLQQFETISL